MAQVYLLHFSQPYKRVQHYIGWAKYLEKRLAHHRKGSGARFTAVVVAAGIELVLARVWENQTKKFERRLKNYKKAASLCPVCSGEHALQLMTSEKFQPKAEPSTEQETENYGRNFWQ